MPVYECSALTTITTATAGTPIAAFRASSAQRAEIIEIGLSYRTAPATNGGIGIARSTAIGTGTLTQVNGMPRDPSDSTPGTAASIVTAWATAAPTIGSSYLRRWYFPASLGNGIIWTFDRIDPMEVPAQTAVNSELVFVNLESLAPGTLGIYVAWEE